MSKSIVYVDDSGTHPSARIVSAAFCVATEESWGEFERKWQSIGRHAGFAHFHMTEFSACRRGRWCAQCQGGKTTIKDHPWRRWSDAKRKSVLKRLAKSIVQYVDCGFGISVTKKDYEDHVLNSPARRVMAEPVGEEHFTYAVQLCGGELAKWRAANTNKGQLMFVFDLATPKQRDEIANVFFGAAEDRAEHQQGLEQWFKPLSVSFQSRKNIVQLLSADMVAWVTAKIRAAELYGKAPLSEEAYTAASIFIESGKVRVGYMKKETLQSWETDKLGEAVEADAPDSL
jgi:hypothetical protein